jgi:hypothetical protein
MYLQTWSGTDDQERSVANGVYYYKITARQGKKSVEYRGKVARYR